MDVPQWCLDHLGAKPVALLHRSEHMSEVLGLRLDDGREIAVKSRPGQNGREATCVEVQRFAAAHGFPCAAPLTGVTVHDGLAVHAEQWRPGGEMRRGDDPAGFATLLAELVTLVEPGAFAPPLPNPDGSAGTTTTLGCGHRTRTTTSAPADRCRTSSRTPRRAYGNG